tara:strand:+ start:2512 stop:2856 length:345 start_codon:yes stop_codon:yes gene_type:complete
MNLSILSLESLSRIDPSPFFILSLIPYLVFLHYASKTKSIPKLSFLGFKLTLLFVFMTIIFAIISQIYFEDELTNVDLLHGLAESFLTISDALVVFGFVLMLQKVRSKKLLRGE